MRNRVQRYYGENPLMVSSPFGGVDGIDGALLDDVLRRLDIELAGRAVLDVGCGRGFSADFVRSRGASYVGVDFVKSRGGFPLVLADAARLPFRSRTFDVVMCIDAFEHFPAPIDVARAFRELLRPGGCVFLSAPNYGNVAGLVKKCCERFGGYARDTWAPFRRWQAQELEHALTMRRVRNTFRRAGFTTFRGMGYGAEMGLGLFPWLEHPGMPEAIKFRLQRFFATIGPAAVRVWPGSSLHTFWKIGF